MSRGRITRALDWLRSRRLVGEDEHHLFFTEFLGHDKAPRRYVEYKDSDMLSSSDRMSTQWWAWLHHRRDDVPTAAELAADARQRATLAHRVAQIEADDERNRLQQRNYGEDDDDDGAGGGSADAEGGDVGTVPQLLLDDQDRRAVRRESVLAGLQNAANPAAQAGGPPLDELDRARETDGASMKTVRAKQQNSRSANADDDMGEGAGDNFKPSAWTPPPSPRRRR